MNPSKIEKILKNKTTRHSIIENSNYYH